jgi:hypothetical protein
LIPCVHRNYRQIEKLLSRLGDKYTRFMDPNEFQKLTKYDVTGRFAWELYTYVRTYIHT